MSSLLFKNLFTVCNNALEYTWHSCKFNRLYSCNIVGENLTNVWYYMHLDTFTKKNIVLMTVQKIYKVIWSYDKVKSRIHRTITQFDYPIWIVAYVNGCVMIFKWIVSNTINDINWFTVFYGWLRPCIMADLSTQLLNFDANSHRSRWTTDLHSWTVPSIWFLALILLLASFISKFSQITLHLKYQNKLRLLLIWMHAFIWMRLFVWLIRKSIALASAKNHCAIIAIFREKLLQLWIMDIFIHPK